jgi:hypothetical protein
MENEQIVEQSPAPRDDEEFIRKWLAEIDCALKREKGYRKKARHITSVYETKLGERTPFNILFSNTETLAPALYNATPRPIVQRRFKDEDNVARIASMVGQRTLEYLLDTGGQEYPSFDEGMQDAVLGALVPGRGLLRFKYDATLIGEQVTAEQICAEVVPWNYFCHGYAKTWEQVPWIVFMHPMTKQEVLDNFGTAAAGLQMASAEEYFDKENDDDDSTGKEEVKDVNLAWVYEVWDKKTKKVFFVSPGLKNKVLRETEDPLGLEGFYPCPKPLQLFNSINSLLPVPLYNTYENQAEELNHITTRISKIIVALKVRGFYDGTLEKIQEVMDAADNTLVPVENTAAMQQGQTLEKSIWLMPIDKLIGVLQQLYQQRQQIKQVIYEITGIADIMRGSSMASETLGAQEIKNQWGTLRLKRMQKLVSRFARDSLRIMLEIAVTKLSPQTLEQLTGINLPDQMEKQQAQALLQQAQQMQQQPPEDLVLAASLPTWDEILTLLQNDLARQYKIDIETNSTVDAEATEDKQNIAEFMNAMAQFFNGISPLVESGAMPFEAARAIMLAVTRRFRFGAEIEDELKKMQPPKPPQTEQPDPTTAIAAQTAIESEKVKQQTLAMEAEYAKAEHAMKMQELQQKSEIALLNYELKKKTLQQQAAAALVKPASGDK